MDHRTLLKKYIRRVRDAEGESFIPLGSGPDDRINGAPTVALSVEDIAELRALEAEGAVDEEREDAAWLAEKEAGPIVR